MIAEAGGTRKVIGSRIATPFTEPSPGIAPMKRPSVTPTTISAMFIGWIARNRPWLRSSRISMVQDSTPGSADRLLLGVSR